MTGKTKTPSHRKEERFHCERMRPDQGRKGPTDTMNVIRFTHQSQPSRFSTQRNRIRGCGSASILQRFTRRATDRVLWLLSTWTTPPGDTQTQARTVADEIRAYCHRSAMDAIEPGAATVDNEIAEIIATHRAEAIELTFLVLDGRSWSGCAESQLEAWEAA